MKKFLLVFFSLYFVSISVAYTLTDDPKKSGSNCPYIQKMESSKCPFLNNKPQGNDSNSSNSECPYSKKNSEKSKEMKKNSEISIQVIRT
ncbi:MAG: hypothetical protein N2043_02690 [Ignavibacterium sp.]|nr:hypothetical protein [Ignavibacterium sp.]